MPSSEPEEQQQPAGEGFATAQQDQALERSVSGVKRKEPEKKKHSFKALGHMVMAMKRFSESLNPTYTYGKRTTSTSSGGATRPVTEEGEAVSSSGRAVDRPSMGTGRPTSPADGHEHPKYAYSDRGHKFDFLIKPLPATEEEEAAAHAGK